MRENQIVIIGGGLGGLSAAIHLRLAGREVTLYEANQKLGGRANLLEKEGFRFDTGPSLLNYPWVFEELFAAAGRNFYDYVKLLPVDPSLTFRWPDGTQFALTSDLQQLVAECERLESGVAPGLMKFLREAEQRYRLSFAKLVLRNTDTILDWWGALSLWEMWKLGLARSLAGELKRYFKSRHLREAFGSYGMYLGGSPYELPGAFTILPYGELSYGLWLPEGGIYGLVEAIERLARELGVVIHTGRRVARIITKGKSVAGVQFANGELRETACVVSNVDVPTTDTALLQTDVETITRKLRRRAARTSMTPGVTTFYWGVRGPLAGLGHHTIFLPDDFQSSFDDLLKHKRIPRALPFYVSLPSATDATLAPPGDTAMFALAPTPLISQMPDADWPALAQEIKAKVLFTLRQAAVKLEPENIVCEDVFTPVEWRRRFGLHDGSAFGAAHNLRQIGPFRAANASREVAGLYYVGAGTTPGTGLPMVTLGGKMTAERVLRNERAPKIQRLSA
jgi:phytoene desaturase